MSPGSRRPERLDPRLVAVYKRMSPEERIAAALDATRLVRSRLEAHLGARDGSTPERVRSEISRRFLRGSG